MKSGILLLARTGSTRLPGKLLLPIMDRPILEYQIERLRTARRPDLLVLCTTRLPEDDILVDLAAKNGLPAFRGSTDDVVDRMVQAAGNYHLDFIVSIGGDDVFADPPCVDRMITCFAQTAADFLYCPGLPVGGTPFGVKSAALERLRHIKTGGTDGWERYFMETGLFRVELIPLADPVLHRPDLRMTLDYPEDFQFFQAVITELYPRNPHFSLQDVITLIDQRPDIAAWGQKRATEWRAQHTAFHIAINPDTPGNEPS